MKHFLEVPGTAPAVRTCQTIVELGETAELKCQCGQMIGGPGGRTCPLPQGRRCEHLIVSSARLPRGQR